MEILGWIGSTAFCLSGVPILTAAFREGRTNLPWNFLILWFIGALCTSAYVVYLEELPLITSSVFNAGILVILLYYKIKTMVGA